MWHHLAFSLDMSSLKMICFVDGKRQADVTVSANSISNIGTRASWIGSRFGNVPFIGLVDDVQIRWGVVLR